MLWRALDKAIIRCLTAQVVACTGKLRAFLQLADLGHWYRQLMPTQRFWCAPPVAGLCPARYRCNTAQVVNCNSYPRAATTTSITFQHSTKSTMMNHPGTQSSRTEACGPLTASGQTVLATTNSSASWRPPPTSSSHAGSRNQPGCLEQRIDSAPRVATERMHNRHWPDAGRPPPHKLQSLDMPASSSANHQRELHASPRRPWPWTSLYGCWLAHFCRGLPTSDGLRCRSAESQSECSEGKLHCRQE